MQSLRKGVSEPEWSPLTPRAPGRRSPWFPHSVSAISDPNQLPGFFAGPGYDLPTGLGTPVVSKLLTDLAGREGRGGKLGDLAGSGQSGVAHGHVRFNPGG